ncbi:N-acetyltransferase [Salibacterium sp. K-3]
MQETFLKHEYFKNINLEDPFFDSLKADYNGFEEWFRRKGDEKAYYYENEEGIQAFLYLKIEDEELTHIEPPQPRKKRIKIGTLKINPHGTRLGERFVKKALDYAVVKDIKELYVTIFAKHTELINLLYKYGFYKVALNYPNGKTEQPEEVMFKNMEVITEEPLQDYPLVNIRDNECFLLSINPEYHTELFPDSILTNESFDLIQNVSHTNSIHKVYISNAPHAKFLTPKSVIVIYRTGDGVSPAEYRAVATSVCVLEEVKTKRDFNNLEEYLDYCKKYSVFSETELRKRFNNNVAVLKMTYNLAMERKLIRRDLADQCGLNRKDRWTLIKLTDSQMNKITELGGIHESFVIN